MCTRLALRTGNDEVKTINKIIYSRDSRKFIAAEINKIQRLNIRTQVRPFRDMQLGSRLFFVLFVLFLSDQNVSSSSTMKKSSLSREILFPLHETLKLLVVAQTWRAIVLSSRRIVSSPW